MRGCSQAADACFPRLSLTDPCPARPPLAPLAPQCCVCPVMGGALKPTTIRGVWCHSACMQWIPGVRGGRLGGRWCSGTTLVLPALLVYCCCCLVCRTTECLQLPPATTLTTPHCRSGLSTRPLKSRLTASAPSRGTVSRGHRASGRSGVQGAGMPAGLPHGRSCALPTRSPPPCPCRPAAGWDLLCTLCRQRMGAKIQCESCFTAYHPLCARLAGACACFAPSAVLGWGWAGGSALAVSREPACWRRCCAPSVRPSSLLLPSYPHASPQAL